MHSLTLVNVVNGGERNPPPPHGVFQNYGEQSLCWRGLETWRVHPGSETAQEGHSLPHPSVPNSVRRYVSEGTSEPGFARDTKPCLPHHVLSASWLLWGVVRIVWGFIFLFIWPLKEMSFRMLPDLELSTVALGVALGVVLTFLLAGPRGGKSLMGAELGKTERDGFGKPICVSCLDWGEWTLKEPPESEDRDLPGKVDGGDPVQEKVSSFMSAEGGNHFSNLNRTVPFNLRQAPASYERFAKSGVHRSLCLSYKCSHWP